jgi:non-canonical purine NTP pyrophosphatase (RdgB/HAM1 family)
MDVTLVTGNTHKADQFAGILGYQLKTVALDIPEIQSLDLIEILEAKASEAFRQLQTPLIVDDVSLVIDELKGLPGPLVKWFVTTIGPEGICRMADMTTARRATAVVGIGYCDKNGFKAFVGEGHGVIAQHPAGTGGFGWDSTLVQDGWDVTRAELSDDEYQKASIRKIALDKCKSYLSTVV